MVLFLGQTPHEFRGRLTEREEASSTPDHIGNSEGVEQDSLEFRLGNVEIAYSRLHTNPKAD